MEIMKIEKTLIPNIKALGSILDSNIEASDKLNRLFFKKIPYNSNIQAQKQDPSSYRSDPYFSLISGLHAEIGHTRLKDGVYQKHELFLSDETFGDPAQRYREVNPLGYFESPFTFPELEKKADIWMSLIPHEINTMKQPIASAHGHVLTLGLGLGYYAFRVSENPAVTAVDVIDLDPEVIALFKEKLLPLFPHKEKIHLIEGDAIAFSKSKHPYDYVFVDLYHNEEDGLPLYLELKPFEKNLLGPKGTISYWVERSLLCSLRRYVMALLLEEAGGSSDEDYPLTEDETDILYHNLHVILHDRPLKTEADLAALLSDQGLRDIAAKM
jgi:Spermidine synthase